MIPNNDQVGRVKQNEEEIIGEVSDTVKKFANTLRHLLIKAF